MTRAMAPLALLLVAALAFPTGATAHHRDGDQSARIAALEAKVAELERRLAALEAARPSPPPTPTASPTASPTPPPTPVPTTSPGAGAARTVTSIAALRQALADDAVSEIVVANGTYHVSPANRFAPDSLWIGGPATPAFDYAKRTRPILVRAETIGGVTFDGTGGGTGYAGLTFMDGAHHQTWQGFRFANMVGAFTGIVEIGGYSPSRYNAPHHITLRDLTFASTLRRSSSASQHEHAVYFASSRSPGPHDITLERFTVDATDPVRLWSAIHAYHGTPTLPHSWNVTIRDGTITGTKKALALAIDEDVMHDWRLTDVTVTGYAEHALYWESIGAQRVVFERVRSSGGAPGSAPIYSSRGLPPPGLTLIDSELR